MFKFNKWTIVPAAASLIFALLTGGSLPYTILYIMMLLLVVSYLWTRYTINRIEIHRTSKSDYAYVGDTITVTTRVFNEGMLPIPYVEARSQMERKMSQENTPGAVLSVLPYGSKTYKQELSCMHRGFYSFGPMEVTVSDVFGLFTWGRKVSCEGTIAVYPRIAKLSRYNIMPTQTFGTISTNQKASEDYSNISDIRKYYPGDSFKKIHWKVSARKGSLHVKNYDMSGSAEAYIFMNLYHKDYEGLREDKEEKAVECAASIINYMLSKEINLGFYANNKNPLYIKGRDLHEFKKFMDELIRINSDGETPLEEMIEARFRLLSRNSTIIIITPVISRGMMARITQLKEIGYDVVVNLISDSEIDEDTMRFLKEYKIGFSVIGLEDDIKKVLEG